MGFLDPYAVDGATITGAQLRQAHYESVKGFTGVSDADSLKVVAIPGSPGVVGIRPGNGSISVASRRESYQVTNTAMDGDALIDVPPAGSSGAAYHVIVEVTDPQFEGDEPAVTPRLVSSLAGLTKPHLVLARFSLAPGAGFDVQTPVEDLRVVTHPAQHMAAWAVRPTTTSQSPTGSGWQDFQRFASATTIPEWAGRVLLDFKGAGLVIRNALWHGWFRIAFKTPGGLLATEPVTIRVDGSQGDDRFDMLLGDLIAVPADRTGTSEVVLQVNRSEGNGRLELNQDTTLQLTATWIQAAR